MHANHFAQQQHDCEPDTTEEKNYPDVAFCKNSNYPADNGRQHGKTKHNQKLRCRNISTSPFPPLALQLIFFFILGVTCRLRIIFIG